MSLHEIGTQQRDALFQLWKAEAKRAELERLAPDNRTTKLRTAAEQAAAREAQVASLQAGVHKALAEARSLTELPQSAAFVPSETANHPVHEHQRSVEQVGLALQSLRQSSVALADARAVARAVRLRRLRALTIAAISFMVISMMSLYLLATSMQRAQREARAATQHAPTEWAQATIETRHGIQRTEQAVLVVRQQAQGIEVVIRNADWRQVVSDFGGVAMALVPAGCFVMGSEDGDPDERPAHVVCFEEPFWIDVTEVTKEQYIEPGWESGSTSTSSTHPHSGISWDEAMAFCAYRNARLPTEAEWEYAARGPDGLIYPWGNAFIPGNAIWNASGSTSVGSLQSGTSWVGALDMSGSMWEWVADWYGEYPPESQVDPKGPDIGQERVLRGGSWFSQDAAHLRATNRSSSDPARESYINGFRCARSYNQ